MYDKRAISIREFCKCYGIGRTTAYDEIADGRLRAIKVGRKTLIPLDDAEAWLASRPPLARGMACRDRGIISRKANCDAALSSSQCDPRK
jgi:excisionase family DNA binding protein